MDGAGPAIPGRGAQEQGRRATTCMPLTGRHRARGACAACAAQDAAPSRPDTARVAQLPDRGLGVPMPCVPLLGTPSINTKAASPVDPNRGKGVRSLVQSTSDSPPIQAPPTGQEGAQPAVKAREHGISAQHALPSPITHDRKVVPRQDDPAGATVRAVQEQIQPSCTSAGLSLLGMGHCREGHDGLGQTSPGPIRLHWAPKYGPGPSRTFARVPLNVPGAPHRR